MSRTSWRHWVPGTALAVAAAVSGCGGPKGAANGSETGAAGNPPAADTSVTAAANDSGTATKEDWTDANIVALIDEANQADSSSGSLAATKGTAPEVKAFGKLMMKDHHAMRSEGQQLAKRAGITPAAPADDPVASMAKEETSALQSAAKGPEFDRTYIEKTVAGHQAVLDLLAKSEAAADNPELKGMITKARPKVQEHLTKAEAIQKKLSTTT